MLRTKPDTAHTPGPWKLIKRDTTFDIVGADGVRVLSTSWHFAIRNPYPLQNEALANAHLAAAAPDMRTFLDHDQWQVIDRAIERYTAGEISDLHALGLITAGFLKLDADRNSVAAKAEGSAK